MGAQVNSSGGLRPCLICRRGGRNSLQVVSGQTARSSCATSLCTIFGLPGDHPFKTIYERSLYCDVCFDEVQEADLALGKLEILRQSLLRFQNKIYSKLGDNYFKIEDVDSRDISYADLEDNGDAIKGRKFTYEDILKIVYEKLDKESHLWERFSSEGKSSSTAALTSHSSTQTDVWLTTPQLPPPNPDVSEIYDANKNCDGADNESSMQDSLTELHSSLSSTNPGMVSSSSSQETVSFTKSPVSFDENDKRYCTFDPGTCQRYFYDEYNLQVHIKSFHLGSTRPHECDLCPKRFVDETRLKAHHVRVHFQRAGLGVAFICEHCGKEFGCKPMLRKHIRRMHEGKAYHKCKFCTAKFNVMEELHEHEDLHLSKKYPFACVYCPLVLSHSTALKAHSKQHFPDAACCPTCPKIFSSENSLRHHMKIHEPTTAYNCDQCSYVAPSLSTFNAHLKSHSNERAFTCEKCGHSFKFLKNLKAHKRVHSKEKPYTCQICNESFERSSYLRQHEESHSLLPNYICNICNTTFKVEGDLRKHMKLHQGLAAKTSLRKRQPQRSSSSKKARAPDNANAKDVDEGIETNEDDQSLNNTASSAKRRRPVQRLEEEQLSSSETSASEDEEDELEEDDDRDATDEELDTDDHDVVTTTEEELSRALDSIRSEKHT